MPRRSNYFWIINTDKLADRPGTYAHLKREETIQDVMESQEKLIAISNLLIDAKAAKDKSNPFIFADNPLRKAKVPDANPLLGELRKEKEKSGGSRASSSKTTPKKI